MYLKQNLRFLLNEKQISASELSRRSGVLKQSVSDWLAGVEPRSFPNIKKCADILGVSIDELVFLDLNALKKAPPLEYVNKSSF